MELFELIEKVKQQDRHAFEELYNRFYQTGFSLALRFVKNENDALDIMQDVFITVYSKLPLLENTEKFKSWYMQIVANKCRDYLKKQKPLSFTDANFYDEEGTLQFEAEETNREFIPEDSVDYSETVRIVDEMIGELPEEQRMCILLYYANDMTIPEIAAALQVSQATVKSRLKYGKDKIQAKTNAYEKKTGTKLYGLSGFMLIPFIRWAFQQSAAGLPQVPAGTFSGITAAIADGSVQAASTAANAASTAVGTVTTAANTASTAAGTAGGLFQQIASLTVMQKVIGGVVAGAVFVGSVAGVSTMLRSGEEKNANTSVVEEVQSAETSAMDEEIMFPAVEETPSAKMPLDWGDYVHAEYSGSTGHGTVSAEVDFCAVDTLFEQEKLQAFLSESGDTADTASSFADWLTFSLSAEDSLSNGDTLTVTFTPTAVLRSAGKDIADICDFFGVEMDTTLDLTVEGLSQYEEIDILSMVQDYIIFEGADGNAYAYLNFPAGYQQTVSDRIRLDFTNDELTVYVDDEDVGSMMILLLAENPNMEKADDLEFIYSENGPLSNGDTLTIELGDYYHSEIIAALNPLGYTLETLDYTVVVDGL